MALGGVSRPKPRPLDLRRINKERDALIREYKSAESRLLKLIAADLKRDAIGTAGYRTKRLAVIKAELSALQDKTIPASTTLVTNAYTKAAQQVAESAGIGAVDFGGALHTGALGVLADNMAADLNGAAETVGRRVADLYRREGLRASTKMFVEGQTRRDASGWLVSELEKSVTSFIDKSGREWALERYAEMVLRTTTSEAATAGVVNTLVEAEIDLVEIAVADPCPICAPYEGNVYSLSGTTPGYEPLDDQPPFHPNCECTLTASDAEFDRVLPA